MMKKEYILSCVLLIGLSGCGGFRQKPCEECPEEVSCPESCAEDCAHASGHCNIAQKDMTDAQEFDSLFNEDMNEFIALADDMVEESEQVAMLQEDVTDLAFDDAIWADAALEQEAQKTVFFDFDTSEIRQDQHDILSYNIDLIKKEFEQAEIEGLAPTLIVEGHACHATENDEENHTVALSRAQQVADMYKQAGIPSDCIKVVERGADAPLDEQWKNDRVESRIVYS